MTVINNRLANWKPVKGNYTQAKKICPRCNNNVSYELAWDGDGYGMPGIWTFKYNKIYVFKCPICPNFEPLSKESAKAILKG